MKAILSIARCADLANNVHLENSLRSCANMTSGPTHVDLSLIFLKLFSLL